jgi:hypothetical protein
VFTALVFILYDFMVEKRQKMFITSGTNTFNAIANSLFPKDVRDRLMEDAIGDNGKPTKDGGCQWEQINLGIAFQQRTWSSNSQDQ